MPRDLVDKNGTTPTKGRIFQWDLFPIGDGRTGDIWKVATIKQSIGVIVGITRNIDGHYTERDFTVREITLMTDEEMNEMKKMVTKRKEELEESDKSDEEILSKAVNKKK